MPKKIENDQSLFIEALWTTRKFSLPKSDAIAEIFMKFAQQVSTEKHLSQNLPTNLHF